MYRMRDIEDWLYEAGLPRKVKIHRGRFPELVTEAVMLLPRAGSGMSTQGAETEAGLEVRTRAQSFDRAEEISQLIDEIIVPFDSFDDHHGLWIGEGDDHRTLITGTSRPGAEPAMIQSTERDFTFGAFYTLLAARRSRTQGEIDS